MQVCAKHGKIAKLDYLFHKTGPQKGKPRGYAFVEYSTKEVRLSPLPRWVVRAQTDESTAALPHPNTPVHRRFASRKLNERCRL